MSRPKRLGWDEVFSEAQCAAWLADSGKKALLSSLGVGTVDQAVCAALPVRYQSLRVLGLCRGVLIIDEVHCYEAYLNELIGGLLEFMAGVGGSVILLSATLNRAQKEKMIERFWAGQGIERDAELVEVGYPLITMVQEGGTEEVAVGGPPPRDKKVRLEMLSDRQILLEHLTQASQDGACACWIRNTVDDARRGYEELKSALGRDRVLLFHARMAMQDRLDREEEVLRLFGKSSSPATRAGRVLVATQVVEQSLDLDFDLMASDLCPMDQIIQRVGRLFRHARPDRPYQNPRLLVLGPLAEAEPQKDWFRSFFPGASYVYPHHGQLWLSAELLSSQDELILPRQSRELIEQVFGPGAQENTPEALLAAEMDQEGRERADRSIAVSSLLRADRFYGQGDHPWLDETPTRLSERSSALRLARWRDGVLSPWAGGQGQMAWQLSQVSVRQTMIAQEAPPQDPDLDKAVQAAKKSMADECKYSLLIPLSPASEGLWRGRALNGGGDEVEVAYDVDVGLRVDS